MYNPQHNIGHEPIFVNECIDAVVVLEARVSDDVLHRLVESCHTIAYIDLHLKTDNTRIVDNKLNYKCKIV